MATLVLQVLLELPKFLQGLFDPNRKPPEPNTSDPLEVLVHHCRHMTRKIGDNGATVNIVGLHSSSLLSFPSVMLVSRPLLSLQGLDRKKSLNCQATDLAQMLAAQKKAPQALDFGSWKYSTSAS